MLRAIPKNWVSSVYKVLENNTTVAILTPSWVRESAELNIQGTTYNARREHLLSGAFLLESGDSILARAVKPRALYRSFQVEHADKKYTLEAESVLGRKFVLLDGPERVGSIYPQGALSRKAVVDLPEEISLPGRIFMFWLVMIQWAADSSSAAIG